MSKQSILITLIALASLVLMLVIPVSASTATVINQGATVFIGEGGLNISAAVGSMNTAIGWWAPGAVLDTTAPDHTISMSGQNTQSFTVTPSEFAGRTGNWYRMLNGVLNESAPSLAFYVADPQLDLQIWEPVSAQSFSGKSIVQGTNLTFRISSNLYTTHTNRINATGDVNGFITLKVRSPQGAVYTQLLNSSGIVNNANSLVDLILDTTPYNWKYNWATGANDVNGQHAYPVGTYTIWAESTLNNMKDNYKNTDGSDYSRKTVSPQYTINLASDTVSIVANKDTVVRSKSFAVTITGKANSLYYVWVKGTRMMSGNTSNGQPPLLVSNIEGVTRDSEFGPYTFGSYEPQNSAGRTIQQDVPQAPSNGTSFYAQVLTGASGTRTVEFTTNTLTKAQKYTIRVETATPNPGNGYSKSDEVDITVAKGAVSVVASGDQTYYLGEEIKFTGTNSETYQTYLFITGPNLPTNGADIKRDNPREFPAKDGDTTTFQVVDVDGANTWSWRWGTANYAIDAGTYTIYAVSGPQSAANLTNVAFGTTSITIKKPFVSATASQSTVAKGDKFYIVGIAEGKPALGIQIWILGKNYMTVDTTAVSADASFQYEVTQTTTKNLASGQYFLVAQHPMQNSVFDIRLVGNKMYNAQSGMSFFTLLGAGSLQGSDAAEALVQGINDPNVDDTYTKLQFLIENPFIVVKPVGDKHTGDKFTVIADTNLAVNDDILVEVYSSSFKPTQKSQNGEFSGISGTVKVAKGENGMNKVSFDVDSSTFKPDEYIVTETAILQDATGTALFTILEGIGYTAPVTTPTVVAPVVTFTPEPTLPPTAMPTVETTAVPKPTASPGAGALLALVGLVGVAFIVVRRE